MGQHLAFQSSFIAHCIYFHGKVKGEKHPFCGTNFLLNRRKSFRASEKNSSRTVIPKKGGLEELGNRRRRNISQISTISNPQEHCHIAFAEFLLKQLQIINKEAKMLKTKWILGMQGMTSSPNLLNTWMWTLSDGYTFSFCYISPPGSSSWFLLIDCFWIGIKNKIA